MIDLKSRVAALRRPRLLVSAARFGLDDYNRQATLSRLLVGHVPDRPGEAVIRLLEVEEEIDAERRAGSGLYAVARHVEVLIALMGEAANLRTLGATEPDMA